MYANINNVSYLFMFISHGSVSIIVPYNLRYLISSNYPSKQNKLNAILFNDWMDFEEPWWYLYKVIIEYVREFDILWIKSYDVTWYSFFVLRTIVEKKFEYIKYFLWTSNKQFKRITVMV